MPQETLLFNRSIKDNITYSDHNAQLKDIEESAKAADCHEFISSLVSGYDI